MFVHELARQRVVAMPWQLCGPPVEGPGEVLRAGASGRLVLWLDESVAERGRIRAQLLTDPSAAITNRLP